MARQGDSSALKVLVTGPYRRDPTDAVRLVGTIAGILSIGAGVIHISAAGDHTNLPVMFAGFMIVATLQIVLGALLLWQRPSRLLLAGALALTVSSLGLWMLSRTAGIPFLPDGHQEPIGFKDGVTKLFEIGSIPALLLLLSRDLSGVVLPSPRLGSQILSAMGAATFALFVPALLLNGGEHHSHAEAVALGIHDGDHEGADALAHEAGEGSHTQTDGGHHATSHDGSDAEHGGEHGGSSATTGGHSHSGTEFASAPFNAGHEHAGNEPQGEGHRHDAGGDHGDHRGGEHRKRHRKHDKHRGHHRGGGHGKGGHEHGGGGADDGDAPVSVSYDPSLSVCVSVANVCVP